MLSISESQKKKMLSVLETAAKENNVDILYETIRDNPNILKEIEDTPFAHTPLHVAASHGNTIFAAEMMSLTPSFSRKLNCEGLSPLHLALQNGHLETAREMIGLESGLIRVAGRGKMTAMHFLVSVMGNGENDDVKKKVDLLIDFVWACPEAVSDVTVEGRTPLHIAVASKSVDAFKMLFGWVCRTGQNSVLDKHDIDGNNLMHLAALTHQTEIMRRLKGFVSVTKENKQGLTPADITTERLQGRIKIVNIKQEKEDISKEHRRTFFMSQETFVQRFIRIIACAHRGMSMDKRNMMLVVATLVATATYQVVLQPPTGIAATLDHTTTTRRYDFIFGSSTANRANLFNVFVPLNTLALNLSLAFILFVLPLDLGSGMLQLTLLVMSGSYITVMRYILEKHKLPFLFSDVIYAMFGVAIIVQLGVRTLRAWPGKPSNFHLQIETVLRSPALTTKDNN
ncbi:ankyrin repeat-containing protein BDA1-like isoform X1 [Ipomoea triloba]|uniref:ankyrin repeat-containing protein BDA1-like isoform X1 n=1 Tax=Ipomoea triloba TaxID=35885 RepID=UPI00125D10E4|nr:ankyrin repeat-containing protein BDA1-like isoform X1 [Ipomoea triloba]